MMQIQSGGFFFNQHHIMILLIGHSLSRSPHDKKLSSAQFRYQKTVREIMVPIVHRP